MPTQPKNTKDASEIAQEIERSYQAHRKLLRAALKKATVGTNNYLKVVEAMEACDRRYREERSRRGLDAANLGPGTRSEWHFVARCMRDGSIQTVEVRPEDVAKVVAEEIAKNRERTKLSPEALEIIRQLDEEFPDYLPRPQKSDEDEEEKDEK